MSKWRKLFKRRNRKLEQPTNAWARLVAEVLARPRKEPRITVTDLVAHLNGLTSDVPVVTEADKGNWHTYTDDEFADAAQGYLLKSLLETGSEAVERFLGQMLEDARFRSRLTVFLKTDETAELHRAKDKDDLEDWLDSLLGAWENEEEHIINGVDSEE